MNITCLKIAALLIGFGVSLKCSAADESTPSPTTNSTLPPLPSQIIDGMQKFQALFHLTGNNKISYKVTVDIPPNPAAADALDKQYATVTDPPGINRRAQLASLTQSIRRGSRSVFTDTLYISKTPKLMFEKVCEDELLKGYDTKVYFTDENITEVEPSAGIVTIFPCDVRRYLGLMNYFPALYGALGYIPDKISLVPGDTPVFGVVKKNIPIVFELKLDSSQSLAETDEVVPGNIKLSVTKFEYSAQSHLWPSSIKSDSFGSNGTLEGHEQWDLLKIEKLPDGFDFNPKIEANYRIVDKTSTKSL